MRRSMASGSGQGKHQETALESRQVRYQSASAGSGQNRYQSTCAGSGQNRYQSASAGSGQNRYQSACAGSGQNRYQSASAESRQAMYQKIYVESRRIGNRCWEWWQKSWVDVLSAALLIGLALFFCWFEIGRFGIFGSSVDWISQHSVIPEHFRQQFYATGELFPEFAPGLGGGQNLYNFAYYGLYSPLILPSYLLPSVRMGDYLMAVSMLTVAASAVLFYGWMRSQGQLRGTSFFAALLLTLSGPLIFQSARQVMFVNYMPFLCLALWGVDRYLRRGKPGVYLSGVFLMIMTSFYYSVGGMLVLVIYGLHRYLWYREHLKKLPDGGSFFSKTLRDIVRLLLPMLAAVLLSAFFLVPTAVALAGKRGCSTGGIEVAQLLMPQLSLFKHLYSAYAIGLTTFVITVLISGLFWRGWSSRILIWSCIAVLSVPVFMWLLNGCLYVREKALIPFLPLFCYVIVCYCARTGKDKSWKQILAGSIPYAMTLFLLYKESGHRVGDYILQIGQLPEKLQSGSYLALADRRMLVLLDALLMLVWYIVCQVFWNIRGKKKSGGLLLVFPVLFLVLFGTSFRSTQSVEDREFYEQVNQEEIGKAIEKVLALDDGFYRIEQLGNSTQQAANINRVWNARQYLSSIYSSSYNGAYQEFRMNTFDVEEPADNFMMQRSSTNAVFQRLMGVRYLVKLWESPEAAADKENSPFGYEWFLQEGCVAVYKNQAAAPICYATDQLITEETYRSLDFPLNQTILERYAVRNGKQKTNAQSELSEVAGDTRKDAVLAGMTGKKMEYVVPAEASGSEKEEMMMTAAERSQKKREKLAEKCEIEEVTLALPELETEEGQIEKTETGYRISADKTWRVKAQLTGLPDMEGQILHLQFQVRNQKPWKSMSIWINGVQNTLASVSASYFYYNNNTAFTYAVPISDNIEEVSVTLGKGEYEITELRTWIGQPDTECTLYQSEFLPDWTKTKGNRICGQIDVKSDGCFITSIPYDDGFEVKIDGEACPIEKVNTAFLGFPIGKGQHSVEIVYHAPGAAVGRGISLFGILIVLLFIVRLPGHGSRLAPG